LLQACRKKEEAYSVVSRQLKLLFPNNAGALGLLNAERQRIEVQAQWGDGNTLPYSYPAADCWALRRGKIHIVDAAHPSPACPHMAAIVPESQSYLCLPLTVQGETLGVLTLQNFIQADESAMVPVTQQQLAVTASDHIALALANLDLRETLRAQSIRDVLTGLYNRRFLEESLPREVSRARRKGVSLGVIMLDLDFFKRFNDTLGHDAGDVLLQELGRWLGANVRAEDIVCRYGGEEFILILPEVNPDIIVERAQFLCEGVRNLAVQYQGRILEKITASLGVSIFPLHGETRDELIRAADIAMYQAKSRGRDQVVVADTQ
jgi:diguanylate cyclase (GGDEF)-like protein